MIKLVASDVDGTLVPDGTTDINPEIYDVISSLHDKGIMVAIASGRHWTSIEHLFEPIKEKIFYISDNGAYVGMHGRALYNNNIEHDLALEYMKAIKQNPELEIMISTADANYSDSKNKEFLSWIRDGYHVKLGVMDDILTLDQDINKISAYYDGDIKEKCCNLIDRYSDRLTLRYAGAMWLDGNAKGISKGIAIGQLQEAFDIHPEETMVFGDQENDITMLQKAYYSYAVANAVPKAKEAARFETSANTDDGVLKVLKTLL